MAMASNPNRNNREIDESQSSRPVSRRTDPAHGSSNVPVLFRLKNLQRTEAAVPAEPTMATHGTSSDPHAARIAASSAGSGSKISSAAPSNVASSNAAPSTNTNASNKAPVTDPVKAPGKHGVSNGFILLAGLVAVAFAIGRNTNKSPQVATATPTSKAATAALPQDTSSVASTPAPLTPLAPPSLPTLVSDAPSTVTDQVPATPKAPLLVSVETGKDESVATESAASPSIVDASNDDPISLEAKPQEPATNSDKLPVPSMLVTAKKDLSQAEETLSFGNDSTSTSSVDTTATQNDSTSNSATSNSASAAIDTSGLSIGPDSSESTKPAREPMPVVRETMPEKPAPPSAPSKVVTTTVPDMDTAQLYEMRANFQSQMDALAKARQGQAQQAMTPSAPQQNMQQNMMQPTLDQAMAVGQQAMLQGQQAMNSYGQHAMTVGQQTMATGQQTMAAGQNAMFSAGQQAMAFGQQAMSTMQPAQPNMNVAPPLQGYGQPQQNQASFGQQPPATEYPTRTQYTPPTPSAPVAQYQSATQQAPGNPYATNGRQAGYPAANVQPSQRNPAQAYQPLFATPPANPVQGYGQPAMPQGTASPYPNSAPSFQSN